ncbi:LysE family transporter [Streptomyces sp. MMS24-I29]|uniref:LysE family transporter n=1 Tax=Streptomyces sp. MMS24-I29 TaxID=3351480 RepID=UPI003C7C3C9C
MTAALVAGLPAGFGIAVPVGAVGSHLVGLTARTSLRTGACAALGVATADGLYAAAALVGGSSFAAVLAPVMPTLRAAPVLVLIAPAVHGGVTAIARYRGLRATSPVGAEPAGPGRSYLLLFGITLMNPATVVHFAALVLGSRTTAEAGHVERAVFVLAAFLASASWQLLLAGGGALLGRVVTSRQGQLVPALAPSVLITALAVRLL